LANNGLDDTHKIGLISLEGLKNTAKISSGQLTLANNIEYTISELFMCLRDLPMLKLDPEEVQVGLHQVVVVGTMHLLLLLVLEDLRRHRLPLDLALTWVMQ
jgi:hypothetical protein